MAAAMAALTGLSLQSRARRGQGTPYEQEVQRLLPILQQALANQTSWHTGQRNIEDTRLNKAAHDAAAAKAKHAEEVKKLTKDALDCGNGVMTALKQDLRLRVGDDVIVVNSQALRDASPFFVALMDAGQGLTLVHFSAQRKPFVIHHYVSTPLVRDRNVSG